MKKMNDLIKHLKEFWSKPKKGIHNDEETFFELMCEFSSEKVETLDDFPFDIPEDLKDFWNNTKEAGLFIDKKYGQWGLKILSPDDALLITREEKVARPYEYKNTELIIGYFIGDSDKLVIDCETNSLIKVLVSHPIDSRKDWEIISDSFKCFLILYAEKNGEKFWENNK